MVELRSVAIFEAFRYENGVTRKTAQKWRKLTTINGLVVVEGKIYRKPIVFASEVSSNSWTSPKIARMSEQTAAAN